MKYQILQKIRNQNQNIIMDIGNIKEYLGVGAGAVGYLNQQRHYPSKSIEEYIKIH